MMETVHVAASRDYDVHIGSGLLDTCGTQIAAVTTSRRCALVTDSTVAPLYAERVEASLRAAGMEVYRYVFPAGEQNKNLATYGDSRRSPGGEKPGGGLLAAPPGAVRL